MIQMRSRPPSSMPGSSRLRRPSSPGSFLECSAAAQSVGGTGVGPPWAGVCISGGGSRSLSAAMGELRGLDALGLLPKIGWLSTVSGGTWAGTLFNWAPESLLRRHAARPARARSGGSCAGILEVRRTISDASIRTPSATAATRLGLEEMLAKAIELYHRGVAVSELWPRAIGELVLAPFGLGDAPQRYFSWTSALARAPDPRRQSTSLGRTTSF